MSRFRSKAVRSKPYDESASGGRRSVPELEDDWSGGRTWSSMNTMDPIRVTVKEAAQPTRIVGAGSLPQTSPLKMKRSTMPRPVAQWRREKPKHPAVIGAVGVLGFVVMAALIADFTTFARGAANGPAPAVRAPAVLLDAIAQAKTRYQDPRGWFSIALPDGWTAQTKDPDGYDVKLTGPQGITVSIVVTYSPAETLTTLREQFVTTEKENGVNTHIEDEMLGNRPALRRTCRLGTQAFRSMDTIDEGRTFHLIGAIPGMLIQSHMGIVDALIATMQIQSTSPAAATAPVAVEPVAAPATP